MGKHAISEFAGHHFSAGRTVIERGDEREDGGAGIGGPIHVADVDLVERGFAHAQHQRALLLEGDVGGALDEMGSCAIGDPGQGAHAARDHDHGVGGIRAAGHVGADIGVGLLVNLVRGLPQHLRDQVAAAFELKFLGEDTQGAVGSDEVDRLHALVALDGQQKLPQEDGTAGAGSSDGQILRRKVGQVFSEDGPRGVVLRDG
jgi:hypothetical protein